MRRESNIVRYRLSKLIDTRFELPARFSHFAPNPVKLEIVSSMLIFSFQVARDREDTHDIEINVSRTTRFSAILPELVGADAGIGSRERLERRKSSLPEYFPKRDALKFRRAGDKSDRRWTRRPIFRRANKQLTLFAIVTPFLRRPASPRPRWLVSPR